MFYEYVAMGSLSISINVTPSILYWFQILLIPLEVLSTQLLLMYQVLILIVIPHCALPNLLFN